MNIDLLYLIIGIIVTLLTSAWGIRYASKHKNKIRLLFIENDCLSLFKSVVRELNDLEIKFKGRPINENLITYKGTIFNTGNIDIDKNIIHEPLQIYLPDGFEWRKVKITDKSNKLLINLEEHANKIQFTWDILKTSEYFTFDSIIEYKGAKNINETNRKQEEDIAERLYSGIKITQRITNLDEVDKELRPTKPDGILSKIVPTLLFLLCVYWGFYMSYGQKYFPDYKLYHEVVSDSTKMFLSLDFIKQKDIEFRDSLRHQIFIKNFDDLPPDFFTGEIRCLKERFKLGKFIFGIIITIITVLLYIALAIAYFDDRRLYSKIKSIIDKT